MSTEDLSPALTASIALVRERDALRAELERVKADNDFNNDVMAEIRRICAQIMGGNCAFIDDDVGRALLVMQDERNKYRALAESAMAWVRSDRAVEGQMSPSAVAILEEFDALEKAVIAHRAALSKVRAIDRQVAP